MHCGVHLSQRPWYEAPGFPGRSPEAQPGPLHRSLTSHHVGHSTAVALANTQRGHRLLLLGLVAHVLAHSPRNLATSVAPQALYVEQPPRQLAQVAREHPAPRGRKSVKRATALRATKASADPATHPGPASSPQDALPTSYVTSELLGHRLAQCFCLANNLLSHADHRPDVTTPGSAVANPQPALAEEVQLLLHRVAVLLQVSAGLFNCPGELV